MLYLNKSLGFPSDPPIDPVPFNPYPDYSSTEYLTENYPVQQCYLDKEETVLIPDVYAYPGLPQHLTDPFIGSYSLFGLEEKMCSARKEDSRMQSVVSPLLLYRLQHACKCEPC